MTKTHGDLEHGFHSEMLKHLEEQLPCAVEFSKLVNGLKLAFEGCWSGLHTYSRELHVMNPVFNRHGDFLLDLGIHMPGSVQIPSRKPSSVSVNGGYNGGFRNGQSTNFV